MGGCFRGELPVRGLGISPTRLPSQSLCIEIHLFLTLIITQPRKTGMERVFGGGGSVDSLCQERSMGRKIVFPRKLLKGWGERVENRLAASLWHRVCSHIESRLLPGFGVGVRGNREATAPGSTVRAATLRPGLRLPRRHRGQRRAGSKRRVLPGARHRCGDGHRENPTQCPPGSHPAAPSVYPLIPKLWG